METFVNSVEREMNILCLETELEVDKGIHDFYNESSLSALEIFIESDEESKGAEKSSSNRFIGLIEKIIKAVKRVFSSFISNIKDAFKLNDNITAEDYFKDPNVKIQFTEDVQRINEEIDEEILKGRKIVQKISKGTHMDPRVVADYCDKATNFAGKVAGPAILATTALGIGKVLKKNLSKSLNIIETTGNELRQDVIKDNKNARYDLKRQENEDKYYNSPSKLAIANAGVTAQQQCTAVLGAMEKYFNKAVGGVNKFMAKMYKFSK